MFISNIFNNFNFTPLKTPCCRAFHALPCDTVSFQAKKPSLKTQIEQMPKEALPSEEYREYLINELSEPDNQKELIDIHNEYYKGLEGCTTLDEAKEKYPEFKDVVDAKDVDLSIFGHRHILSQISKGELSERAPELSLDNISLGLLKKYYAETISINDRSNYWGLTRSATSSILSLLKIKMSPEYSKMIISSKAAKKTKQQWQDEEFRKNKIESSRVSMLQRWSDDREKMLTPMQTEEFRAAAGERGKAEMTKRWADPEYREKMHDVLNDPEVVKKRHEAASNFSKERWQDEEYREKILGILNDPEVVKKRNEATSKSLKERWQDPEYREKILGILNDPKVVKNRHEAASNFSKERWQDEEYRLLMTIVSKAAEISWDMHPECSEIYKDVAKEFPSLAKIINKKKAGESLSDFEQKYLSAYYKTCHEVILETDDGKKSVCEIIAETQKSILSELGFYDDDRDIQKIAELIGIEQKDE